MSSNNLLQHKNILPISFSLIISIMIFTSLFAVSLMHKNSEDILDAMSQQNLSHKLIKTMSEGADRRSSIVFEMLHTDDPFINDELFLELNTVATKFTVARTEFEGQVHNHSCKPLLAKQGEITRINAPLQLEVYELLQKGERNKAIVLYENTTLPKQKEINRLLDNISKMEFDLFQSTTKDLKKYSKFLVTTILVFDLIGVLLSIFLTFYVIKKQRKNEAKLAYIANTDILTKLPNRGSLLQSINDIVVQTPPKPFALIFIDIDHFKSINDNYGHDIGDAVLCEFSLMLSENINSKDILARFGGDEFVLILNSISTYKEAIIFTSSLSRQLDISLNINNNKIFISASIGGYYNDINEYQTNTKIILKNADIAMYSAKQSGRNCYKYFSEAASKKMQREHEISYLLKTILNEEDTHSELFLLYQPLVCIEDTYIKECEALMRWTRPDGGVISPDEFIHIAEKTNLIEKINAFAIDEACKQQYKWKQKGIENIRININLSGNKTTFLNLLYYLQHRIHSYGLKPSQFGIELVERFLFDLSIDIIRELNEVRNQGMKISIDDFGTGYSSLSYLKKLPITTIKIDKSFIAGLPDDKDDCELVKTIITLGHSLKLDIVAEGVETLEQLEFLKSHSCDIMQGYYLHRPLEHKQITKLKLVA